MGLYFVSEYALHKIFTKPPRQFGRAVAPIDRNLLRIPEC